jgi:phosphoglycerate dehydrogenase-like enzyme
MKAFGSHIIGIKRTILEKPDFVDEVYTVDNLNEQLSRADIVALCLPCTKSTYRMFTKERLFRIKKGAILLNAGRGNLLDTEALCNALEIGHLAGAGIDVTDPEPLLEKTKLWDAPNIIITPHVAGGYHLPETLEKVVRICKSNLSAYNFNSQYINVVNFNSAYKVSDKKR